MYRKIPTLPPSQVTDLSSMHRLVSDPYSSILPYLFRHHDSESQSENDNLRDEYQRLLCDVPSDIPFARIALQKEPDAINMWIGNDRSTTALHKDNYENIYVQVRGQKHFVLLPPVEMPCVNEQSLPLARYEPERDSDHHEPDLVVAIEEVSDLVPVATWDPDIPDVRTSSYSHLAKPLRVTLKEGDMLYLPAM
jgi:peptidyl-lysine (3S)-dioxygenase / protease